MFETHVAIPVLPRQAVFCVSFEKLKKGQKNLKIPLLTHTPHPLFVSAFFK
jgi:hypothetical protein